MMKFLNNCLIIILHSLPCNSDCFVNYLHNKSCIRLWNFLIEFVRNVLSDIEVIYYNKVIFLFLRSIYISENSLHTWRHTSGRCLRIITGQLRQNFSELLIDRVSQLSHEILILLSVCKTGMIKFLSYIS